MKTVPSPKTADEATRILLDRREVHLHRQVASRRPGKMFYKWVLVLNSHVGRNPCEGLGDRCLVLELP